MSVLNPASSPPPIGADPDQSHGGTPSPDVMEVSPHSSPNASPRASRHLEHVSYPPHMHVSHVSHPSHGSGSHPSHASRPSDESDHSPHSPHTPHTPQPHSPRRQSFTSRRGSFWHAEPLSPEDQAAADAAAASRRSSQQLERRASIRLYDPEVAPPTPPPRPPSPVEEDNAPPPAEEVTLLRLVAHYSVLVLAAMLGLLIRLGLEAIGRYDGAVIFPLAWVQGVGCSIMGLALARKNEIVWIYPPLYTFFTTGIAGSVTTFSSWMLEGWEAFANTEHANRGGFHDTVNGVAYSLATLAISTACLRLGQYTARLLPSLPKPSRLERRRRLLRARQIEAEKSQNGSASKEKDISLSSTSSPSSPRKQVSATPVLDIIAIFSAVAAYAAALAIYFAAPGYWRHRVTFALLLAPPGAMARFFLAKLNARSMFVDRFPAGTFIANMAASLLIAGCYAASRRPVGVLGCNALTGVSDGFCGCLSTVSTFVVEMRSIRDPRWRSVYLGVSVVLGHVFVLAVAGGVGWGVGYVGVCEGE